MFQRGHGVAVCPPVEPRRAHAQLLRGLGIGRLDPLRLEPGVTVTMVGPGEAIPGDTRLVIV